MTETTTSPSEKTRRQLTSWDATRQERYRAQHSSQLWHFLLDASPSMHGIPAIALRLAFNRYLEWLKRHADPMSLAEVRCFSDYLDPSCPVPLSSVTQLDTRTYDPIEGNGTALYRAIGETCTTAAPGGQHVLVVFTDGLDNRSEEYGWSDVKVGQLVSVLTREQGWLCVLLGALPEALELGHQMGFARGNCLPLTTDQIPDAFKALTIATQKYLAAAPAERKLLAAGGIF